MHIHPLITDSATLEKLCERLARSDYVAVDTEFMRENTYWPDLCLIQVANREEAAAIDPKAEGIDLTPLMNLFVNNEHVLKVFHAGGQDIEIVFNLTGDPASFRHAGGRWRWARRAGGYSNLSEPARPRSRQGAALHRLGRRPLDSARSTSDRRRSLRAELFPKMRTSQADRARRLAL